jgi:hypothetical protein
MLRIKQNNALLSGEVPMSGKDPLNQSDYDGFYFQVKDLILISIAKSFQLDWGNRDIWCLAQRCSKEAMQATWRNGITLKEWEEASTLFATSLVGEVLINNLAVSEKL